MTRVLVTRALREAQVWVRDLAAAGLDSRALPLLEIRTLADTSALRKVWHDLGGCFAVMFVSANAVDGFFAGQSAAAFKPRAWATGPGTVAALRRAGVAPESIDAPPASATQFDSEALWHQVASSLRPGQRMLIVRGGTGQESPEATGVGRDWLAQRLGQAGVRVDMVVSYQRVCPALDAVQLETARSAATDGSVWLFSSSEALANLRVNLPAQDWSCACAVATHARIAAAAEEGGFGRVVATRPALADIVASIESLA